MFLGVWLGCIGLGFYGPLIVINGDVEGASLAGVFGILGAVLGPFLGYGAVVKIDDRRTRKAREHQYARP